VSSNPVSAWNALVGIALLGSERAGAIPPVQDALADLDAAVGEAPAQRLLGYGAALSPWIRAGQQPAGGPTTTVEPAVADALLAAGPCATHALGAILTGDYGFLLAEWCTAAARGKRRVPDHLLPEFLDRLARERSAEAREAMRAVLGARGSWLGGLNPAWTLELARVSGDPTALWQTGNKAERSNLLAAVRATDPAAARTLVRSTLDADQPDDVAAFLGQLEPGLSMADHDFLEALLDARHKPVRVAAARLLAKLPESALALRMVERVAARLAFKAGTKGLILRRKGVIEATLPDKEEPAQAKAMARDGIDLNRKRGKLGPKAMTLLQIVAAAPLAWFTKHWGATPDEILDAAMESEWSEALLVGWSEACVTQRDTGWAEALLARLSRQDTDAVRDLFLILPPVRREALLTSMLESQPKAIQEAATQHLIDAADHHWSEPFSRLVLKLARRFYLTDAVYSLRALMPRLAARIAPQLAAEAAEDWPVEAEQWSQADRAMLERLISTLEMRRNYLEEFAS
jgi:hypothetical protein